MTSDPGAEARQWAAAFAFTHALFRKPSPEQHAWLRSMECRNAWRELAGASGAVESLDVPEAFDDYAERFIATFDVGTPAPPVPLIESHYNKREPIPRILHENILFYRQFGVQLRDSALESADHLRHQLEFARHLLTYLAEMETQGDHDRAGQARQACREYTRRHLCSWLPEAVVAAADVPLTMAQPALQLAAALADAVTELPERESPVADRSHTKEKSPCSV